MALPRFTFSFFLITLISCGPAARHDPVLAEAFVGPATVNLRKELGPSATVATLHFGEKVQIIGKKRIFVRIRTRSGAEGWIDEAMLLGQGDIDQIGVQSAAARSYPSQGAAITDAAMNVHAHPDAFRRVSSSLRQERIRRTGTPADCCAGVGVRKSLLPSTPKAAKKPKKESKSKVPPPAAPPAPTLPLDWVDLSKEGEDAIPPKPEEDPPAIPYQDWSMIRTASGQSGWVLSRRLFMAIPDEVAQYAEGHRITSYFPLERYRMRIGSSMSGCGPPASQACSMTLMAFAFSSGVCDGIATRPLLSSGICGAFSDLADSSTGTFSVCLEKADGHRYRPEYHLVENLVKFVDEKPCVSGLDRAVGPVGAAAPGAQPATQGTFDKLKGELKSIIK